MNGTINNHMIADEKTERKTRISLIDKRLEKSYGMDLLADFSFRFPIPEAMFEWSRLCRGSNCCLVYIA